MLLAVRAHTLDFIALSRASSGRNFSPLLCMATRQHHMHFVGLAWSMAEQGRERASVPRHVAAQAGRSSQEAESRVLHMKTACCMFYRSAWLSDRASGAKS